jgi:hypothetical protein
MVDVELLSHAFANIPDEKMNIRVSLLFIIYFFLYILNFIHINLFIVFYGSEYDSNTY